MVVVALALFTPSSGAARDEIAIRGGRIVPMDGTEMAEGTLLIENGKIESLGTNIEIPSQADVIDAAGKWVLPGMIESHTTLGTREEYESPSADETSDPATPQMLILDAINPFTKTIKQARMAGITSAMATPGRLNVIGGQSAVVKLRGPGRWTNATKN